MSSVVTFPEQKTHFDKCIICDRYGYEILLPEQVCLYCFENNNIVGLCNLADVINTALKGKKVNRQRSPVTCYLKHNHQLVNDYRSATEAAIIHGITRSSVFRSADSKRPSGATSKTLKCKIYFRYSK